MGYVAQNLNPGERILYSTRLHWIVLMRAALIDTVCTGLGLYLIIAAARGSYTTPGVAQAIGLFALLLVAGGTVTLGLSMLRRNATEMAVTNKRILIKVGLVSSRTIELFLSKVESVGVEQSLLGSLLGYGSLLVRGTGGTYESFAHVANPMEFRRQMQRQIEGQPESAVR